jgi:uncharacterized protein (TIGR00251 family)
MKFKEIKEGIIIEVLVKPKSKISKIEITDNEIKLFCKNPPIRGKVNKELSKIFSDLFRVEVNIVSGMAANKKIILLRELNRLVFEKIINSSQFAKDLPS